VEYYTNHNWKSLCNVRSNIAFQSAWPV